MKNLFDPFMKKEEVINNLIQKEKCDTNLISDGFHTFGELYEHRITLFISLARIMQDRTWVVIWRCKTDEEWFVLGISKKEGTQITYHLPISKWEETNFAHTFKREDKPPFDGHTSQDVLERLKLL